MVLEPPLTTCVTCLPPAEASDGEKRLFDELFANYSNEVRPRHHPNRSVVVSVELELNQIKKLVTERVATDDGSGRALILQS